MVKIEYGSALAASTRKTSTVELPTPESRESRQAPRRFINEIMRIARRANCSASIRNELARVGMEHALIGGVFLAGGGARMPDLCDVADRVLRCQARFGSPIGIQDWPAAMTDPEWTAAAGLAMYSAKLKEQAASRARRVGWLGRMLR